MFFLIASTPAMNVVLTAPNPGISTPSFPDGASILTPFWTTTPPKEPFILATKKHKSTQRCVACVFLWLVVGSNRIASLGPTCLQIISIHAGYDFEFDLFWA